MWKRIKEFFSYPNGGNLNLPKELWEIDIEIEIELRGLNWKKTILHKETVLSNTPDLSPTALNRLSSMNLMDFDVFQCDKTGWAFNMEHVVALKAKDPVIVAKRQLT